MKPWLPLVIEKLDIKSATPGIPCTKKKGSRTWDVVSDKAKSAYEPPRWLVYLVYLLLLGDVIAVAIALLWGRIL